MPAAIENANHASTSHHVFRLFGRILDQQNQSLVSNRSAAPACLSWKPARRSDA
jgi:hypothetical protein